MRTVLPCLCAALVAAELAPAGAAAAAQGSGDQLAVATSAAATDTFEEPKKKSTWDGEGELGVIVTSGNTKTSSINAKLKFDNERPRWRNHIGAEYLRTSESSVTTAERYVVAGKSDYKLDEVNYLVGTLRYENDRFAGFTYRVSESVGYGHRFVNTDTMVFETEIGAGGRQTKFLDGTRDNEAIARVAAKYRWKFTPTSEFSEAAFSEIGQSNTHSESETSLKLKMNAKLAMKLSVLVKHDTQVPVDKVKTDTLTSINLVYDF
ncbi:MAG TPA: DUF481 domain-containing protein [Gammaproteobacteria bacterium]|nr:DUF481 domain-containing protein [Gammaproteobacteria bacterium]